MKGHEQGVRFKRGPRLVPELMLKAFLEKPIEDVTYEDVLELLEELIAEGNEEQARLELKEEMPKGKDLAETVAAMANAEGGRLIIGVRDRKHAEGEGAKERIVGISGNPNKLKEKVTNGIRDNLDPEPHPFPEVRVLPIPETVRYLLIIDVKPSVHSPHQVRRRGFFIRVSLGNSLLSTAALRSVFLRQGQLLREVRAWIRKRIDLIEQGEGPVPEFRRPTVKTDPLDQQGRLYLHVVSLPFFGAGKGLVLKEEHGDLVPTLPVFFQDGGYRTQFNADGLGALRHDSKGRTTDYTQLLREGAVEVASKMVGDPRLCHGRLTVSLSYLTDRLLRLMPELLFTLSSLQVSPPYHVELALRDLSGAFLQWGEFCSDSAPINRNLRFELHVTPEDAQAIIDPMENRLHLPREARDRAKEVLRPLLDHLWQAAGVPGYRPS